MTPIARSRCGSGGSTATRTTCRASTRASASSRASSAGTISSPRSRAASRRWRRRTRSARISSASRSCTSCSARTRPPRSAPGSAWLPGTRTTKKACPRSRTCWRRPSAGARWRICSSARAIARPSAPSRASCGWAMRCASTSSSQPVPSPRTRTRSRSPRAARARAPGSRHCWRPPTRAPGPPMRWPVPFASTPT